MDNIDCHSFIKVNFVLHAEFIQITKDLVNSFDFQGYNYSFCKGDDIELDFEQVVVEFSNKLGEFEKKDSGWSLKKILYVDMNVNKFNPLRGSSYIDLPIDIKHKKAVLNIKNSDYECFSWAVLAGLYPVNKNAERVAAYLPNKNKLNFGDINFPVKLRDVKKFENLNNMSINVFGLEYNNETKKNEIIGPLHFTKHRMPTHLNLLYLTNGSNGHYCLIKNMSRLLSKQITTSNEAIHICDGCLLHFSNKEHLNLHQKNDCVNIRTELPSARNTKPNWFGEHTSSDKLKFDKYDRQMRVPFVVYADFEAFVTPIPSCDNDPEKSHTNNIQKHNVYSFGYYLKCAYDDKLSKYQTYMGEDCPNVFLKYLKKDLELITKKNSFVKSPLPLTDEDKLNISQSQQCYICSKDLNHDATIDHNWHTGAYSGVAHSMCSSKYNPPRFLPVFLHNLSNYDAHFIVHALNFDSGKIDIIPQNKEKYISFSKQIKVNNHNVSLRFLDSFKFMASSLDKLAQNLRSDQFNELKRVFPKEDDFKRLIKKGIYPYEYTTSFDSLKCTSLPDKEDFYNSLTNTNVSDENYKHAQDIWTHFNCHDMSDYSNLYLKTDVLLLADIFENYRNVCSKTYGLDPAHYFTAPGLSWDAMLKYTQIELQLLTDFDKISFIKKGIRGGISLCSNRYAKANNIFMNDYDSRVPPSFLIYLDANNLYGWAMSQYLPTGEFEWVEESVNYNIPDNSEYGYILEVDLIYPHHLHDSHSDLPFCPETICTPNSNEKKLVPNLKNKIKYIIHYRNLKQCIENGLELTKIHRVLKFKQSDWLKKYIDLNTSMRTSAVTDFEKDFFKLMNNAIFGKTMENIEKRVNVHLVTQWENNGKIQGAQSLIARPEFHSASCFSENLIAVQLNKTKLLYDKPIYLGFCILDISKTLMYKFHYSYMKNKFNDRLKLMYTDTDSLIYHIQTENLYSDIKSNLKDYFDTSDYSIDNRHNFPLVNKKKIGFFKDENNGNIFREFVGLRSKMYAIEVENDFIAKAKGINKSVTKTFQLNDYKRCLFNQTRKIDCMLRFKSIKHVIFTQKCSKISLSHNDTKRKLLENSTDTVAWGHYKMSE
ncbi:uncharacterized protein LOC119690408 isoform X2 [Plutella xylostella]|nr:uncharacterized protein LOC125488888 isoform X2 [Plutella xylostella]XP_048484161.1 uncharacterized protein LOC105386391 isoform X2 [Plutella xylostella]XP_048487941.1 uncharacterized protein LOC119690408 isoform X2 [Plutella xylostella]